MDSKEKTERSEIAKENIHVAGACAGATKGSGGFLRVANKNLFRGKKEEGRPSSRIQKNNRLGKSLERKKCRCQVGEAS